MRILVKCVVIFFPSTLRAPKISLLVINRAAMGRARFMFYLWFILFFFPVTRPKLTLSQILNHATCDVYSPKAVETLIQGQCYRYCFLYLCAKQFLLVLQKRWIRREIINTLKTLKKKVITSAMECADVAVFIFATRQIRSRLLCKFISPEVMVNNLSAILRVFLWVAAN